MEKCLVYDVVCFQNSWSKLIIIIIIIIIVVVVVVVLVFIEMVRLTIIDQQSL